MKEESYYNEIKELIETKEVNSRVRVMQDNSDTLNTYWNIGRLIVEAQGGEKRAKYGNELIKKWSEEFTKRYGKRYDYSSLTRFRKFYLSFPIIATVSQLLSWSHVVEVLPLKSENERNYYINQCIINNLSVRELRQEIKNKSFDRLAYADKENIKLIDEDNYALTIEDMIKDPIIVETSKVDHLDEKALHKYITQMLENRFLELGVGFTLAGHEYKIKVKGHTYSVDLLFFNYKLNAFVAVELKIGVSTPADIDQTRRYANLVDKYVKEKNNNDTIGLLISKGKDGFIIEYATEHKVYLIDYELKEGINL